MADEIKIENITCGYVMPIARTEGYPESHWKDVLTILDSVVSDLGISKKRIVSDGDTITTIHSRIVNNLNSDDIIICDVSSRNPNVMFELGMRIAFDKPVIIIKDSHTDYCFDSGTIEHLAYPKDLRYGDIQTFKDKLKQKIRKTHEEFIKNGDKGVSPILKNFGSFERKEIKLNKISAEESLIRDIDSIKNSLLSIQMSSSGMTYKNKSSSDSHELYPTMYQGFMKIDISNLGQEEIQELKILLTSNGFSFNTKIDGEMRIKAATLSEKNQVLDIINEFKIGLK